MGVLARMRRGVFIAAVVLLLPLPAATSAPAADVQSSSADQPMSLTGTPLSGTLSGLGNDQVAFYSFNYAGDGSTATIGLQVFPDDDLVLRRAGFEVYGPGSSVMAVKGGNQMTLSPNVSADVNTTVKGTYLVKVFNYNRDVPITFRIWSSGQPPPAPQTIDHLVPIVSAAPASHRCARLEEQF